VSSPHGIRGRFEISLEKLSSSHSEEGKKMTDYNYSDVETRCAGNFRAAGQNLMFFLIGGGIGAAIALLLAPKRGSELRGDIANIATRRYEDTLAKAHEVKRRTAEYLEVAKQTGGEVLDAVVEGATAVKEAVSKDAETIGAIVETSAKRAASSISRSR
jgi:gas vesicle protein